MTEPPGRRDQPVPPPARRQSRRLVSVGRRGLRAAHASATCRSSSRSATRRATGATSWRTSRSRTPRPPTSMNRLFVNVKVDREERPDVDAIYMQAVQALTGRGGWPMSVWCTPDGRPFYGGTYFPERRPARHAVVHARVRGRRRGVARATRRRRGAGRQAHRRDRRADPAAGRARRRRSTPRSVGERVRNVRAQFEPQRTAASARAPKFPQAMTIDFLCRALRPQPRRRDAATMITTTLDAMAAGGIHDQLGGGFARYSTDDTWLVPHFEKMLYDNALLTRAYLHGYLVTGEAALPRASSKTSSATCCATCATPTAASTPPRTPTPKASKASSTAGRSPRSARSAATTPTRSIALLRRHRQRELRRSAHRLPRQHPARRRAQRTRAARGRREPRPLLERRDERVRPGLDDKVLLGWNALFLAALTEAAAALDRDDWMDAARTNARFLLDAAARRRRPAPAGRGGRRTSPTPRTTPRCSKRCSRSPSSTTLAWLADARTVADDLLRLFHDTDGGGFFTTGTTPSSSSCAPRTSSTTPRRRRTHSPPTASCASPRSPATTGTPNPAVEVLRMLVAPDDVTPDGFAHLLAALERVLYSAHRDRDRRRSRLTRDPARCAARSRAASSPRRSRCTAPDADASIPLLAGRDRARRTHRLRVRALHVPAAGHDRGRAPRPARRRARRTRSADSVSRRRRTSRRPALRRRPNRTRSSPCRAPRRARRRATRPSRHRSP